MNKIKARIRRGMKCKKIIGRSDRPRLVVHRSASHIYAQIVIPDEKGDKVLASASTLDKELKPTLMEKKVDKEEQAQLVGNLLGKRAKAIEIVDVAFDRAGNRYHGRVKALADGAREAGLNF